MDTIEVDVLEEVLSTLEMSGAVRAHARLGAPWALRFHPGEAAVFHLIRGGECLLLPDGGEEVELKAGDFVLLRRGLGHVLCDARTSKVIWEHDPSGPFTSAIAALEAGFDGARTEMACGGLRVRQALAHPFLSLLPEVLIVEGHDGSVEPALAAVMELLFDELVAGPVGAQATVRRLAEVLLIQVLRRWLADPFDRQRARNALSDPSIVRALGAIHADPSGAWTVEALAREALLSRSVFSARFTELVGVPPMRYVTQWRMQLAMSALLESGSTLDTVAAAVGYSSAVAFAKSFRREVGQSPGAFRRVERLAAAA